MFSLLANVSICQIVTILGMNMVDFEKAKNSLINAVELFLSCEGYGQVEENIKGFDPSENFFMSALYEYIDFVEILSYEKIGNLETFNIYVPMLGRNILVLLESTNEVPYRIKFDEEDGERKLSKLRENKVIVPSDVKKFYRREIKENLSLQDIRSKDVYAKNAHVNKFYNIRKDLVGTPNKNIKFITSQLNEDGSADFLFQTVVTPYEDPNHVYKELTDAPIADIVNSGAMKVNNSGEYMMCLRVNDFWDLIEELGIVENGEFDKNTLSAILDLSEDVKYSCNCVSYVWSGISYFATQENASLIPNNIYPKKWDKYRDGALVCKHLSGLCRNLGFFENLMAMSIKKNMKDQGLLN